jgi:hypothetical protein
MSKIIRLVSILAILVGPLSVGAKTKRNEAKISFTKAVDSETAKLEDKVPFTVLDDIYDGDTLIIQKGASGEAVITQITKERRANIGAVIKSNYGNVRGVDGKLHKVKVLLSKKGFTNPILTGAGVTSAGAGLFFGQSALGLASGAGAAPLLPTILIAAPIFLIPAIPAYFLLRHKGGKAKVKEGDISKIRLE